MCACDIPMLSVQLTRVQSTVLLHTLAVDLNMGTNLPEHRPTGSSN